MTTEEHLVRAEKNLRKAEIAFHSQLKRVGITEQEKKNLTDNLEHLMVVRNYFREQLENKK